MNVEDKIILDACCGSKMFWFDKNNPKVIFQDVRDEEHTLCDGRSLEVKPDIIADFTEMPYPDNSFYHVVWDPPHMNKLGQKSWMAKKYGVLLPTWELDIKEGFNECMRVLKPNGTLIFKWNESQIPTKKIIEVVGREPLYGHVTGRQSKTIWMCFMKLSN